MAAAVITYCFCSGGMLVINKATTARSCRPTDRAAPYVLAPRACTSRASLQPRQPASSWSSRALDSRSVSEAHTHALSPSAPRPALADRRVAHAVAGAGHALPGACRSYLPSVPETPLRPRAVPIRAGPSNRDGAHAAPMPLPVRVSHLAPRHTPPPPDLVATRESLPRRDSFRPRMPTCS